MNEHEEFDPILCFYYLLFRRFRRSPFYPPALWFRRLVFLYVRWVLASAG